MQAESLKLAKTSQGYQHPKIVSTCKEDRGYFSSIDHARSFLSE